MTRHDEFTHTISSDNAPERLKGKIVKAVLTEGQLSFEIDMPDDPTPNELGYFKWFTGELVDKLKSQTGIGMTCRGLEKK